MKTFQGYSRHYKSTFTMCALLGLATVIGAGMVRVWLLDIRDAQDTFSFLVRNLLLAWIPFVIALCMDALKLSGKSFRIAFPLACLVWLVFFPNAPYLLTDFQHLRLYTDSEQLWFDVVLVIWFAFTGLFLGLLSLHLMHRLVRLEFGQVAGWIFVLVVAVLSAVGIYLGRFLRLNSWSAFQNPARLWTDLLKILHSSSIRPAAFIGLYALLLVFIYLLLHVFGSLLQADSREP